MSDARNFLLDALESCNYCYREFLLSPTNFGIPNSRLRYYAIAKQKNQQFCFKQDRLFEMVCNVIFLRNIFVVKSNFEFHFICLIPRA